MFRNESRRLPHGLADLLLPFALIDDGILLQQDIVAVVKKASDHAGDVLFDPASERVVFVGDRGSVGQSRSDEIAGGIVRVGRSAW